jgi:hypothetical protein
MLSEDGRSLSMAVPRSWPRIVQFSVVIQARFINHILFIVLKRISSTYPYLLVSFLANRGFIDGRRVIPLRSQNIRANHLFEGVPCLVSQRLSLCAMREEEGRLESALYIKVQECISS